MAKHRLLSAIFIAGALSGCSNHESPGGETISADGVEASTMAYGYTFRFTLPGRAVHEAQDKHIALCDGMGPARCRVLEMHRSTTDGRADGSTRFMVAAGDARKFGQDLEPPVTTLGGELSSRDFEAADVAEQTTQAQAKVAEKNTADNRAALSQVRQRVAVSPVWVYYQGTDGFWTQVGAALDACGETLTTSVVALIYFLAAAVPWALVLGALFFMIRGIERRRRHARERRAAAHPVLVEERVDPSGGGVGPHSVP